MHPVITISRWYHRREDRLLVAPDRAVTVWNVAALFDTSAGRILISGQTRAGRGKASRTVGMGAGHLALHRSGARTSCTAGLTDRSGDDRAARSCEAHYFIENAADPTGRRGRRHVGERGRQAVRGPAPADRNSAGGGRTRRSCCSTRRRSVAGFRGRGCDPAESYRLMEGRPSSRSRIGCRRSRRWRLIVLERGPRCGGRDHRASPRGRLYARLWAPRAGGFRGMKRDEPRKRRLLPQARSRHANDRS